MTSPLGTTAKETLGRSQQLGERIHQDRWPVPFLLKCTIPIRCYESYQLARLETRLTAPIDNDETDREARGRTPRGIHRILEAIRILQTLRTNEPRRQAAFYKLSAGVKIAMVFIQDIIPGRAK